jgi:hypothetical protein
MAYWSKDKDAANPDTEVINAVTPAMASFPFSKLIKTSTPATEEGVLWEYANIGTYGHKLGNSTARDAHKRTLVLQGPSAAIAPAKVLPRERLLVERAKDPTAFKREFLAQFSKSISGFLSKELLLAAVDKGIRQRPYDSSKPHFYVATLDPAFRRDAFGFAIGHIDDGRYILDICESWRGTQSAPLSPTVALATISRVCKSYGVSLVTSDQYHAESLQELAKDAGLVLEPCFLTSKVKLQMWGDFQGMLNQGKISLTDHPDLVDELAKMEKKLTSVGSVKISGTHDDLATVVALNVHRALQYGEKSAPYVDKGIRVPTLYEQLTKNKRRHETAPWWAT